MLIGVLIAGAAGLLVSAGLGARRGVLAGLIIFAIWAQVDFGALFSIHPATAAIVATAGPVVMEVAEVAEVTEVVEVMEGVGAGKGSDD